MKGFHCGVDEHELNGLAYEQLSDQPYYRISTRRCRCSPARTAVGTIS